MLPGGLHLSSITVSADRSIGGPADTAGTEVVLNKPSKKEAHRAKAQTYLNSLTKVSSAEAEKKLLTEFAAWLRKHKYKIEVEKKKQEHVLLCPYFPPVTPWTQHKFLDVDNLKLLPQLER